MSMDHIARAPLLPMLRHEIANETRRLLRDPSYTAPAIGFPVAFYLLFTFVVPFGRGNPAMAEILFANYLTFGVVGAMLFGGALPLAQDRDQGVLKLKRTTPQPFGVYVAGKLAAALLLASAVALVMASVAVFAVGLRWSAAQWAAMAAAQLTGALAFGSIGLAIGAWFRDNAAPGVVNLVFLPAAALGGLWFPMSVMPAVVKVLALGLPTFHFGERARAVVGLGEQSAVLSVGGLVAWGVVGVLLAGWGLRRRPY
jgi:ABC-2 type transport system permease protein